MKNYFVELVKSNSLAGKNITLDMKSGKTHTFDLTTTKFELCTGYSWIIFTKEKRSYVIDCQSIEMVTIS